MTAVCNLGEAVEKNLGTERKALPEFKIGLKLGRIAPNKACERCLISG